MKLITPLEVARQPSAKDVIAALALIPIEEQTIERVTAVYASCGWQTASENWHWTICGECEAKNVDVVQLGEDPPWEESATATVCLPCLRKAVALVEAAA